MMDRIREEKIFEAEQNLPENERLLVNFVLDETGSMHTCKEATISGFNEYIETLKRRRGTIHMTLIKFNSTRIEKSYEDKPIAEVELLNNDSYQPNDNTPLYDAIVHAIKSVEADRKNVLCIIMTDGLENASREHNKEDVAKMIKEKEELGWSFVYLGANQDSWAVGQSLGLAHGNVSNYMSSGAGYANTFDVLAENTLNYRMATNSYFSEEDRKLMNNEEEERL